MGVLLGLCFGIGVLTMWLALTKPAQPRTRSASAFALRLRANRVALAVGFGCGLLAAIITGLPFVGLLAAIAGSALPTMFIRRRENRVAAQRRQAWPEVIDSLASAVRAGMSLPEAVAAVAVRGPEILRPQFQEFADDYRTSGKFSVSLIQLRDRLQDPVADRIVEALLMAREVGGTDLGKMLRTLGDFVRQDLRLRGEAEARQSWTVNGARLAVAAPWLVLLMLSTRPEAAEAYRTVPGMIVLTVSAAVCAFAYWLMLRLGRLPQESRVIA